MDPRRPLGELRFSTLLVSVPEEDRLGFVRRLGEDVAPRVSGRSGNPKAHRLDTRSLKLSWPA